MQYHYTVNKIEKGYDGFHKVNRHWVSYEKFDGGFVEDVIRECGNKTDVVAVIAFDPAMQEFLIVEQFRIGMVVRQEHPWTMEIVAGFMDIPGESPIETAKRELFEETGCNAINIQPLISYYPSPGGSASMNHLFVAEVDAEQAKDTTGILEDGEDIKVHRVPLDTIKQQMLNGELGNSTAIIAYQHFFLNDWIKKI